MANGFPAPEEKWEYDTRETAEHDLREAGFVRSEDGWSWSRGSEAVALRPEEDAGYAATRVHADQQWLRAEDLHHAEELRRLMNRDIRGPVMEHDVAERHNRAAKQTSRIRPRA